MSAAELAWLPATEIAAGIAARRVSPVEVIEAVLVRADAVEPTLNAFAERLDDAARAAARAGLEVVAQEDAILVRRLKAAGAIIIGRTNLPEFAHRILTDSPAFGVTRSPWNLAHTPGGSSGGGSAALAAGVGPLAAGTDGGGSIRCPASCVGAVGLKPTLGSVPFESFPDAFGCFAFGGPMARHAADAALMFAAMAGPDEADPYSLGRAPPSGKVAEEGAARGLRIGWIEHVGPYRTEAEVARLTAAAVAVLASEGAIVEPIAPPCLQAVFETYRVIATAAHAARLGPVVDTWGEAITPSLRESVAIGRRWSAAELVRAQDRRTVLYREVQALFRCFDLLATPTMLAPPPTLEANGSVATEWYAEIAAPLYPFNLTGHPAASVPAGFTAGGLPVGLQLVAPWYAEQRILDLAALLEARQGFAARRPPI